MWEYRRFYSPHHYRDRLELPTELSARGPNKYRQQIFTPSPHSTLGLEKFCGLYRRKAEAVPSPREADALRRTVPASLPTPAPPPGSLREARPPAPQQPGLPGAPRPRTWRPARGPAASWWRWRRGRREAGKEAALRVRSVSMDTRPGPPLGLRDGGAAGPARSPRKHNQCAWKEALRSWSPTSGRTPPCQPEHGTERRVRAFLKHFHLPHFLSV